jgi:hypothetical protein
VVAADEVERIEKMVHHASAPLVELCRADIRQALVTKQEADDR